MEGREKVRENDRWKDRIRKRMKWKGGRREGMPGVRERKRGKERGNDKWMGGVGGMEEKGGERKKEVEGGVGPSPWQKEVVERKAGAEGRGGGVYWGEGKGVRHIPLPSRTLSSRGDAKPFIMYMALLSSWLRSGASYPSFLIFSFSIFSASVFSFLFFSFSIFFSLIFSFSVFSLS